MNTIIAPARSFLIVAPERKIGALTVVKNADDIRITRNGDTRITRNGDIRVARNTSDVYPFLIVAPARSFLIVAPER